MNVELKFPVSEDEIRDEVRRLTSEIKARKAEIEMLWRAVYHYRQHCSHPGQVSGYNERDGSWSNPCPVCGESK